jgi:hypothetical protein
MVSTVRRELGVPLAGAFVVRTSPTHVFEYPLERVLADADDARLVATINRQNGRRL